MTRRPCHLGLAFQIRTTSWTPNADSPPLGKTAGKDAKAGKSTFVSLHGLDASRRLAQENSAAAKAAFRELPADTDFLVALVDSMAARSH